MGRAKGEGSSGGACGEDSELVSGSGGGTADQRVTWVFWMIMSGATAGGCGDSYKTAGSA